MFDKDLWKSWSAQEETNYKIVKNKKGQEVKKYLSKGYLHFDNRFWFPERKEELKEIIQNNLSVYNKRLKRKEHLAFSPFIKILIKTPRFKDQTGEGDYELETKIRPICFASHIDGLIYGYYSYALNIRYEAYIKEKKFDDCVIAYRSDIHKCNIQFSKEVFDYVKEKGECTSIALDIKGYFDHIDHKILKEKWSKVLGKNLPEDQYRIFNSLTQYSYVSKNSILKKYKINLKKLQKLNKQPKNLLEVMPEGKDFEKFNQLRNDKLIVKNYKPKRERQIGIPQGSPLSAVLSNIYLIDYDAIMFEKSRSENFLYRRYCDDILIVCNTSQAEALKEFAIELIKEKYLLTIQNQKVEVTEFKKNSSGLIRAFNLKKMQEQGISETNKSNESKYYKSLQYLGFEFNGNEIFVRSSSLSKYFRKMKSRIVKTVSMAYGSKERSDKIFKEKLFHRYTHLGKRNFLHYVYNASKKEYPNSKGEIKEGMNSPAIKKQVRRHFSVLINSLKSKNIQRVQWKQRKGKETNLKSS